MIHFVCCSTKEGECAINEEKKYHWIEQLDTLKTTYEELNGKMLTAAIEKSSIDNVVPLIDWFDKTCEARNSHSQLLIENPDNHKAIKAFDLGINVDKLSTKLQAAGFASYAEFYESQESKSDASFLGQTEPVDRFSALTPMQYRSMDIVACIQFVSDDQASIPHLYSILDSYRNDVAAQPTVAQKGHGNTPRTPDNQKQNG